MDHQEDDLLYILMDKVDFGLTMLATLTKDFREFRHREAQRFIYQRCSDLEEAARESERLIAKGIAEANGDLASQAIRYRDDVLDELRAYTPLKDPKYGELSPFDRSVIERLKKDTDLKKLFEMWSTIPQAVHNPETCEWCIGDEDEDDDN